MHAVDGCERCWLSRARIPISYPGGHGDHMIRNNTAHGREVRWGVFPATAFCFLTWLAEHAYGHIALLVCEQGARLGLGSESTHGCKCSCKQALWVFAGKQSLSSWKEVVNDAGVNLRRSRKFREHRSERTFCCKGSRKRCSE